MCLLFDHILIYNADSELENCFVNRVTLEFFIHTNLKDCLELSHTGIKCIEVAGLVPKIPDRTPRAHGLSLSDGACYIITYPFFPVKN